MKKPRTNKPQPPSAALERIRRLTSAAYSAHGGAENMSLDVWRDLELELKRRLKHEPEELEEI
ncbi:MAG TPA: hypothetical protein VNZ64_02760 [Candidatus Acidoferrum sp.]|jgi:hypothetical protein|nr:hypothetical protein [Candidatus Acidoferrum sp.]